MAPRWFQNIKFGRDLTNAPYQDIIENLKNEFEKGFGEVTFESTGPIIEEIQSEDESEVIVQKASTFIEQPQAAPRPRVPQILQSPNLSAVRDFSLLAKSPVRSPQKPSSQDEILQSPNLSAVRGLSILTKSPVRQPSTQDEALQSPNLSAVNNFSNLAELNDPSLPIQTTSNNSISSNNFRQPSPVAEQPEPSAPNALTRRSNRRRHKPVEFARGERLIYKPDGEMIGHEKGFPAKYNYNRRTIAKKRASSDVPDGCQGMKQPDLKEAKKGKYKFVVKQVDTTMQGTLIIPRGKSKPEARTSMNAIYSFFVAKGKVIFRIGLDEQIYVDEKNCDWFTLPQGKKYSLKNCGDREAVVAFIVQE